MKNLFGAVTEQQVASTKEDSLSEFSCQLSKKIMCKGIDSTPDKEMRTEFFRSYTDEPHATRRKLIKAAHPDIEHLFEPDIRPVPFVLLIILSQLLISYYQKDWSWGFFLLVAWSYGGMASHALSLMTHEVSHNLVFKTCSYNEYFGIFCNIGMGFPSSTRFKRYHMEHHQFQGHHDKDMDLPHELEGKYIRNTFMKALWVFLMPATYSIRPQMLRPKELRPIDNANIYFIYFTNALVVYFCGLRGLLYILASTVLGMGFHPCAGHFLAEHLVFVEGFETYSYYGPLNWVCWNVGYHNEHHDFPRVPGWRLPQVKAIASEFYDNLPFHKSWTMVIWKFITNPTLSPYNRVKRGYDINNKVDVNTSTSNSNTIPTTNDTKKKSSSRKEE
eukprot:gene12536-26409_t